MEAPRCKNSECPRSQVVILKEVPEYYLFGCLTCKGTEIRTRSNFNQHVAELRRQQKLRDATPLELTRFYGVQGFRDIGR